MIRLLLTFQKLSNGKNSNELGISSRQEQNNTICTKKQESNPECRFDCKEILPLLQKIQERHYENAFEVTRRRDLFALSDRSPIITERNSY